MNKYEFQEYIGNVIGPAMAWEYRLIIDGAYMNAGNDISFNSLKLRADKIIDIIGQLHRLERHSLMEYLCPTVRSYKQHERYEVLFFKTVCCIPKLVGRISRERLGVCLNMMTHKMKKEQFDGIAVYDCGEYYASQGTIGAYEYGPPFTPTTKE